MRKIIKFKVYGIYYRIRFLPKDLMSDKVLATTWYDERAIDILDSLDKFTTEITIKHEIVHVILLSQGRRYQKKFDVEEMCEFIAYACDEIKRITDYILKERFVN